MHKLKFLLCFTTIILSSFLAGCVGLTGLPQRNQSIPPVPNQVVTASSAARLPAVAQPSTVPSTATTDSDSDNNIPEPVQIPSAMAQGQFTSLWDVIRTGFSMDHDYNSPKIQNFVQMYTRDPTFIENITTQATPYLYIIVQELKQRNMPTELALLPIVESGFQPTARSWCGAVGLWQLMPDTAKDLNTGTENRWYNARESIQDSTTSALNYLKYLYNYFNGDWMLALAAYNSGPGTVQNAINANTAQGLPTDFWSLHLPTATQNYVPQLLALAVIINDPSHYGIVLPNVPNKPLLGTAAIPQQMSLLQAAKFADINEQELKALNPAFTKEVTPPNSTGSYSLNLPVNNVSTFEQNCAANPGITGLERYTYATAHTNKNSSYRVEPGETLASVSRFTGVSIATLKSYNHLKTDVLRPGQILHYPVDTTSAYRYVTYRVKAGDTPAGIAKKYHVVLFNLLQWNNLNTNSKIQIGERLAIRQKISY